MKRLFTPVVITILWAVLQGCASTPSISSISSSDEVWCLKLNDVSWISKASCESYWGEGLYEGKIFLSQRKAVAALMAARARSDLKYSVRTHVKKKKPDPYVCPGCHLVGYRFLYLSKLLRGSSVTLVGSNLAGANLGSSYLVSVNLSGANLSGANLSRVTTYGPICEPIGECDPMPGRENEMWERLLSNTPISKFVNANLTQVDLTYADIRRADLTGANLTGADLSHANLTDVVLTGANLNGANLTRVELEGTIFCNTTMPDGTVNNSGC